MKYNMGGAVIGVMEANTIAWSDFAPVSSAYEKFKEAYETVNTYLALQDTKTNGTTHAKEELRATTEDQMMHVADTVVLHFKLTNKQQEVYDVMTTKGGLKRLSDAAFIGKATKIISTAGEVPPADLTALGLTPTQYADAASNLELFVKSIGSPRKMKGISKLGTAQLATVTTTYMDALSEDLDPAMRVLGYAKPELFFEYDSARKMMEPARRTRELTVRVTKPDGTPLERVRAIITPGNIKKATGTKGLFYMQNMEAGIYSVTLSCRDCQDKTIEFVIVSNEATVLNVVMEPQP